MTLGKLFTHMCLFTERHRLDQAKGHNVLRAWRKGLVYNFVTCGLTGKKQGSALSGLTVHIKARKNLRF